MHLLDAIFVFIGILIVTAGVAILCALLITAVMFLVNEVL